MKASDELRSAVRSAEYNTGLLAAAVGLAEWLPSGVDLDEAVKASALAEAALTRVRAEIVRLRQEKQGDSERGAGGVGEAD